ASKSNDLAKIQLASTFKASSMWIKYFLKHYNLALHRKTKISQKMLADLEQQLLNFQCQRWSKTKPPSSSGVIVFFHEKGWMNEPDMLAWTDSYIEGCSGGQKNEPSLLVFDSFKAHLTDAVKAKLHENNNDLVVIPSGLTSVCQLLDVSINQSFKVALCHYWHKWMAKGGSGKTKKGNLKRAELHIICEWVLSAWAGIDPEIIRHAFRKCSISNTMDRSEDDEIYCDEILSNESEEICQDKPCHISDEQNITIIDSSDEEDCDAIIDKDNNHDAIIDEEEGHDITIVENEEVLVFTIDKQ
ncbi:19762_t:CDS:2, partial [Dentiscutata erythropus]